MIGSAATTTLRTGAAAESTSSRTRRRNISPLAKKRGASNRNSRRPGTCWASVKSPMSWYPFTPGALPSTASWGLHSRRTKFMSDSATARNTPGRTPRKATPRNATIDSANSVRRSLNSFAVSCRSARENPATITIAARTDVGIVSSSHGAATRRAPSTTTPTSAAPWLFAPASTLTAVRVWLPLTGKPWNSPAATFATPMAVISWSVSAEYLRREAKMRDMTVVSVRVMTAMPTAAVARTPTSPRGTDGHRGNGSPCGIGPTTGTP